MNPEVLRKLLEQIPQFEKLAIEGDAYSQRRLGKFYYDIKEYAKAIVWWEKAVEQGACPLQDIYERGISYEKQQEYDKAEKWWRYAADRGSETAQKKLQKSLSKKTKRKPKVGHKAPPSYSSVHITRGGNSKAKLLTGKD